jgi:hypothetical protein
MFINNCVNAHFPKVEASTKQVETQKGANLKQQQEVNNNKVETKKLKWGKTKKEAERQRRIRLNKKKKPKG